MYVRFSGFRKTLLWLPLLLILRLLESLETFSTLELWLFSKSCRQERMKGVFLKLRFLGLLYYVLLRTLAPTPIYRLEKRWSLISQSTSVQQDGNKNYLCELHTNSSPFDLPFVFFFATGSSTGWSKSSTEIIHNVISWDHSLRLLRNLIWPFFICLLSK